MVFTQSNPFVGLITQIETISPLLGIAMRLMVLGLGLRCAKAP